MYRQLVCLTCPSTRSNAETTYNEWLASMRAMQILLGTTPSPANRSAGRAAARGRAYLTRSGGHEDALREDKDLCLPGATARTAVLAATLLVWRSGAVASMAARS